MQFREMHEGIAFSPRKIETVKKSLFRSSDEKVSGLFVPVESEEEVRRNPVDGKGACCRFIDMRMSQRCTGNVQRYLFDDPVEVQCRQKGKIGPLP